MPEIFANLLNLPFPKDYTFRILCQTGATILADAWIDMINLKRMGRWKSYSCVEGYLASSNFLKHKLSETMETKLKAAGNHHKKSKLIGNGGGKSGESSYQISYPTLQTPVNNPQLVPAKPAEPQILAPPVGFPSIHAVVRP